MLISSTDLSFTKNILESDITNEIVSNKNSIYIAEYENDLINIEKTVGDIAFLAEQGVKRYEIHTYTDNFGETVNQGIWQDIVNKLDDFSYYLGNVDGAGATGYFRSHSIDIYNENFMEGFLSNGGFQSIKTEFNQLGEALIQDITDINKDRFIMGKTTGDIKTEKIGFLGYLGYDINLDIPLNYILEEGFTLTKNSFFAKQSLDGTFTFEAEYNFLLKAFADITLNSKRVNITAPLGVDFTGSPINLGTGLVQRKNRQILTSGNDTSYDFRRIASSQTDETSPFDSSGKTIAMFNGFRVPQGAYNLYIGVRNVNGAVRIMGENGYGDGTAQVYRPIWASSFDVVSSYNLKTNIEEYNRNALEIVDTTKIYNYNYKGDIENGADELETKKVGMIVEYSPEVSNDNNSAIDVYKMNAILWKATQELNQKYKGIERSLEILLIELEEKGVI